MSGNRLAPAVVAAIMLVAACDVAEPSSSTAPPTAGPPTAGPPTAQPAIDLASIIVSPEAAPLGMRHDESGSGRDALTMLIISGREAEFAALSGFVDARWTTFSGDAGALLSLAMVFEDGLSGDVAFHQFQKEVSGDDGYGFAAMEPAGLGFEGTCGTGANPALDGLIETICLWRDGSLILIAGGPLPPADLKAIAAAMDARATRREAAAVGPCRGAAVDWSAMPPVAQAWGKAWNERDGAARLRLLEGAWADSGDYADPPVGARVVGREAVSDEIGQFMEPGDYFEPREWISSDEHHGYATRTSRASRGSTSLSWTTPVVSCALSAFSSGLELLILAALSSGPWPRQRMPRSSPSTWVRAASASRSSRPTARSWLGASAQPRTRTAHPRSSRPASTRCAVSATGSNPR
jgi:hypothetical protein